MRARFQRYWNGAVGVLVLVLVTVTAYAQHDTRATIDSIGRSRKSPAAHSTAHRSTSTRRSVAPHRSAVRPHPRTATAAKAQEAPAHLVVSPLGKGTFKTIGDALKKAKPGAQIIVRSGVYSESLVIDRPVEISRDPDEFGGTVTIEGGPSPCIVMQTTRAVIRGMMLRMQAGVEASEYSVDVPCGRLLLEDCNIAAGKTANIGIHGSNAASILRRCKIHDGSGDGVLIADHAQATLEGCDIYRQARSGVFLTLAGKVTMKGGTIHNVHADGLTFHDNAQGLVEGCDIYNNDNLGVLIAGGSDPTLRECKIHDSVWNGDANIMVGAGVMVGEGGKGTLQDCDIYKTRNSAVWIVSGHPTIRGCKLRDSGRDGVSSLHAEGVVENCDITNNAWTGVAVDNATMTVRDSRIIGSQHCNVWMRKGEGTLENCEIAGSAQHGVNLTEDSNPVVRNCRIHNSGDCGILASNHGKGAVLDCEVWSNTGPGMAVNEDSELVVHGGKAHDNGREGIWFGKPSRGTVGDCEIFGNTLANVGVDGGSPLIQGCTIHNGKSNGVSIYNNAHASVESCDIVDNAGYGVELAQEGTNLLRNCRVNRNGHVGIWVQSTGAATVENCDLTGNAGGPYGIQKPGRLKTVGIRG